MEKIEYLQEEYNLGQLKEQSKKEQTIWMWLILLGCFLLQMLPYCVALNMTSLFSGSDWMKWLKGDATMMGLTFTIGSLCAAIAGPFIAKLFNKKISMRLVYALGVVVAMAGFFGSGINAFVPAEHRSKGVVCAILWINNTLSRIGVMIFSGLGINNLISKWWPAERRGFALGIVFTGGSLGNIWMQQLAKVLANKFNNHLPFDETTGAPIYDASNPIYQSYGNQQWVTYLILAAIGLVGGLLIVAFVCKKPIPIVPQDPLLSKIDKKIIRHQCVACQREVEEEQKISNQKPLEASPIVTRKYPVYWILGVGYLILQMAIVHGSMNGTIIQFSTSHANPGWGGGYTSVMATGGTIFGVSCLVGNFMGGVLNDKIGPHRSIAIAGIGQCAAILCLMFSVKTPALVFVYFVLAGLSVYLFTSTPSYISGRLYGAGQSNAHMSILGMFTAIGFAIVNSISGTITGNLDKTNKHTMFGHQIYGNIQALEIFALAAMVVGTITVSLCAAMILNKGIKGLIEYSPTKYSRIVFKYSAQIKFIVNKIIFCKNDFRKEEKAIEKYKAKVAKLDVEKQNAKLQKDVEHINKKIEKEKKLLDKKVMKINTKLEKISTTPINNEKQNKLNVQADKKLNKLQSEIQHFKSKVFKTEWDKYKAEQTLVEHIKYANSLKTKLQDEKEQKISTLNKKIQIQNYICQYNVGKLKEGIQLLNTYYNNPHAHYQMLIDKALENKLERKIRHMKHHVALSQIKYDKIIHLEHDLNLDNKK